MYVCMQNKATKALATKALATTVLGTNYLTTLSDQSKPNRGVQAVMYGRPNKAYIYNETTDAKQQDFYVTIKVMRFQVPETQIHTILSKSSWQTKPGKKVT